MTKKYTPEVGDVIKLDEKSRIVSHVVGNNKQLEPGNLKSIYGAARGLYVVVSHLPMGIGQEIKLSKLTADGEYNPAATSRIWFLPYDIDKTRKNHIFTVVGKMQKETVFTKFDMAKPEDKLPKPLLVALNTFDNAAQWHGQMQEYGSGNDVGNAKTSYDESRKELIAVILKALDKAWL